MKHRRLISTVVFLGLVLAATFIISCGGGGGANVGGLDSHFVGLTASKSISASGGSVDIPDLVTVSFPQGAGVSDTSVRVYTTSSTSAQKDLSATYGLPDAVISAYVVHISLGTSTLNGRTVSAVFHLSPEILSKAGSSSNIRVYSRNYYSSDLEDSDDFINIPITAGATSGTFNVNIPEWAFSAQFTNNETKEAQLLLYVISSTKSSYQTGPPESRSGCGGDFSLNDVLGRTITSSEYGDRFGDGSVQGQPRYHKGLDIKIATGTPIYAPIDGTVTVLPQEKNPKPAGGNQINLSYQSNSDSYSIKLLHLDHFATGISSGQTIHKGTLLGYSGSTGHSTGPHLHIGITEDGVFFDPEQCNASPFNGLWQGSGTSNAGQRESFTLDLTVRNGILSGEYDEIVEDGQSSTPGFAYLRITGNASSSTVADFHLASIIDNSFSVCSLTGTLSLSGNTLTMIIPGGVCTGGTATFTRVGSRALRTTLKPTGRFVFPDGCKAASGIPSK